MTQVILILLVLLAIGIAGYAVWLIIDHSQNAPVHRLAHSLTGLAGIDPRALVGLLKVLDAKGLFQSVNPEGPAMNAEIRRMTEFLSAKLDPALVRKLHQSALKGDPVDADTQAQLKALNREFDKSGPKGTPGPHMKMAGMLNPLMWLMW